MSLKNVKILTILYVGLITLFALLSGAGEGGVLSNLPNILPWLLVWVVVAIAWKNSKIGGSSFLGLAVLSVFFFQTYKELVPFLIVSLPLAIIGVLFLNNSK